VNGNRLHLMHVPEHYKDELPTDFSKVSPARVCIFSTDADLLAIHLHARAAFDLISELERKLNFTMRPGTSLVRIVEAHSSTLIEEERQQCFCF
jgi:hypothetical protein